MNGLLVFGLRFRKLFLVEMANSFLNVRCRSGRTAARGQDSHGRHQE
jgi:hypothetical protein